MALLRKLIQPAQLERCGDRSFPVLSMTMHDGIMLQSDRFKKSLASVDQSAYKVVRRNQLVVGFPIDEGVLYIQQVVDAGIMSPAYDVWNVDETKVDLRYFELCLHSPQSMMFYKTNLRGTTARRRSLPKETLLSLPVPVPSMERQREIASALDRLQELIRLRQHQLCALDQLIKARFVELFGDPEINPMGWRVEKLGALLSVEPQNGLYKPQSDYVQDGTGTPILRIDAFYEGKVTSFSGLKRLACTDTERMRYLLHENDIVINRVNSIEYLGKCAWITGMIEPTVFESNMMRFHVDESQVDPCYLTRLLCSTYMYNQILNRAKKAVNQASINQGDVQSFLIVVPPIGLQKSFATFVSQVDKSKVVDLSVFTNRAKSYII